MHTVSLGPTESSAPTAFTGTTRIGEPRYTHRPYHNERPPPLHPGTAGVVVSYSLRSASMGFSFDAFTAGISPNTTPITMENATATAQAPTLMATGVPITELSI